MTTNYPTDMHGPAGLACQQTNRVAKCAVCHTQWQVKSFAEPPTDAQGCPFCGADKTAITIISEAPDYPASRAQLRR